MTLTKAELADSLMDEFKFNKKDSKNIVEQVFEEIRHALEEGRHVKISGFGNFDLRDKKPRPGRNPKTGQDIEITGRRVVTFKPGQKLKDRVKNFDGELEGEEN